MATKSPSPGELADQRAALLDVHDVADLLNCSARHVHRLARTGRMPEPIRVGSLVRWNAATIRAWIDGGCPLTPRTSRP